jgi:predicted nucleotidyltransferase
MNLSYNINELEKICSKYQADYIGVFGSTARGENSSNSDIDILVRFNPQNTGGLFELSAMRDELENVFQKKVDLLTEGFLSKYFRQEVLNELKTIYAKTQ